MQIVLKMIEMYDLANFNGILITFETGLIQ